MIRPRRLRNEFHIVTLQLMPGGAAWWDELTAHPHATPVALPGAEAAVVIDDGMRRSAAAATDGVNVVFASSGDVHEDDSELVVALIERTLAALNAP